MKKNTFQTIFDAYQLAEGAQIRSKKNPEEIFILAEYQADKRGYMVYPVDHGVRYEDFGVLMSENELIKDYEIGSVKITAPSFAAERKVA